MNYGRLIVFVCCLIGFQSLSAQSLDRMVIGATGTNATTGSEELTYTVGEIAIETEAQGAYILTQGFHQSGNKSATGIEDPDKAFNASLFPNPTNGISKLVLTSKGQRALNLNLSASNGKMIPLKESELQFSGKKTVDLDFGNLATGYYLLNVTDKMGHHLKSFKVFVE